MRRRGTRAGLIGLSAVVLGLVALGPAPAPAAAVGCVPTTPASCTLRELAVLAGVRIGATAEAAETADADYSTVLAREFGSLTPENAMKWYALQPSRGSYSFTAADTVVDFAVAHGMEVRGHTLVWAQDTYTPAWVKAITDPNDLRSVMQDHITTVVNRYEDRVHRWDVLNEPLASFGTGPSTSVYWTLGADWIAEAFAAARAADPTAELWLNEYGSDWVPGKHAALLALVADLVADGVPIDGVGIQTHRLPNQSLDVVAFAEQLRDFTDLGLEVAVTELDVPTSPTDAAAFTKQAVEYGKVVDACLALDGCTEVTTWGITDASTWLDGLGTFPIPTRPLLFDAAYAAKPAYDTVRARLAAAAVTGRIVPAAPTVTGVTAGNARVTVAFTPAATGTFTNLSFTASCASTNGGAPGSVVSAASPIVVTGLTNARSYRCRVSATNLVGTGPESALSAPLALPTTPGTPGAPSAVPGAASATVSWTAPLANGGSAITGYVVTPTRNGVGQAPRSFVSTATTQVITGLTNLAAYTFTVAAVNAIGTGAASAGSAAVSVGVPIAPTAVRAVAASGRATATWTAPAANGGSPVTAYVVTPVRNGIALAPAIVAAPATSRLFTGLTNGAAYSFRVAARNAVGTGPVSAAMTPITVGPTAVPGAPGPPAGIPGDGRAVLLWTEPVSSGSASITSYTVTPFLGSVPLTPRVFLAGAVPTITGLVNGQSYVFTVRAVSA
ncbi:MAG: endo-1,4-beta-xylanase, partial [Actinomycetota bacterium]